MRVLPSSRVIAFLLVWATLGVLIGYFWFSINSSTNTTGWSIAVIIVWYYGIPLGLSLGITSGIFKKLGICAP